jgi:hypothetical protein
VQRGVHSLGQQVFLSLGCPQVSSAIYYLDPSHSKSLHQALPAIFLLNCSCNVNLLIFPLENSQLGVLTYHPESSKTPDSDPSAIPSREHRDTAIQGPVFCSGHQSNGEQVAIYQFHRQKRITVGNSPATALSCLEQEYQPCYIWCDSLLPNLDGFDERAARVLRMADICKEAPRVVVWPEPEE